jgi:hypothetical protein
MLFTLIAPHIKSKELSIGGSLFSKKTYDFYTRNTAYKNKGLPIGGPLFSKKTYAFNTRSTAYKKQGAPDRWSLIQQKKLMPFTRVAPRTKSKGLLISGPLFSRKTYSFYTRSTAYKKQGAPDRRSLIKKTYVFLHT